MRLDGDDAPLLVGTRRRRVGRLSGTVARSVVARVGHRRPVDVGDVWMRRHGPRCVVDGMGAVGRAARSQSVPEPAALLAPRRSERVGQHVGPGPLVAVGAGDGDRRPRGLVQRGQSARPRGVGSGHVRRRVQGDAAVRRPADRRCALRLQSVHAAQHRDRAPAADVGLLPTPRVLAARDARPRSRREAGDHRVPTRDPDRRPVLHRSRDDRLDGHRRRRGRAGGRRGSPAPAGGWGRASPGRWPRRPA